MSPTSLTPLPLLGTPSQQLMSAARGWFGDDKGAGFAPDVHRMAARQGRFDPESLGAGPRAASLWRQGTTLALPEISSEQTEQAAHGELRKRTLRMADGRVVESVSMPMGRGRR